MSFGERLARIVRANLNNLMDRTFDRGASPSGSGAGRRLEEMSDAELEAELRRRRARREAAERAAAGKAGADEAWREAERAARQGSGRRYRTSAPGGRAGSGNPGSGRRGRRVRRDVKLARYYAQLELAYGADLDTVRRQYRTLMRKYHPDLHHGSPERQRLATEVSQRLTAAYNEIRRALEARRS